MLEDQIGKVVSGTDEIVAEVYFNGTFYESSLFFAKRIGEYIKKPQYSAMQTKLKLRYNRLGHCNQNYLKEMLKKNLVDGMAFDLRENLSVCDGCGIGNLRRTAVKSSINYDSTSIMNYY